MKYTVTYDFHGSIVTHTYPSLSDAILCSAVYIANGFIATLKFHERTMILC